MASITMLGLAAHAYVTPGTRTSLPRVQLTPHTHAASSSCANAAHAHAVPSSRAAVLLHVHNPLRAAVPPRVGAATMLEPGDLLLVLISLSLVGAAGYLQYSVTKGEQGLNAFLMKEKSQNPFYSANFRPEERTGWRKPEWLPDLPDLKLPSLPALPDLPFVEVYDRPGADPRRPESANDERSRLYTALNAAVEAEDYEEARRLKEQIDTAMMPEMKDTL